MTDQLICQTCGKPITDENYTEIERECEITDGIINNERKTYVWHDECGGSL